VKREEILDRLKAAGFGENISEAFAAVEHLREKAQSPLEGLRKSVEEGLNMVKHYAPLVQETPVFQFALREDLKDDLRFLPTRAESKASGWDVRAATPNKEPLVLEPFQYAKIDLGFRAFCPEGWWFELKPRSSTFAKKNLHCLYGTIDETYEGQMVFAVQYIPAFEIGAETAFRGPKINAPNLTINFSDAIGQLIPVKRQEMTVEQVSNADYDTLCKQRGGERGSGGFGSTSK
jgi:dUTP pyrophosphatase